MYDLSLATEIDRFAGFGGCKKFWWRRGGSNNWIFTLSNSCWEALACSRLKWKLPVLQIQQPVFSVTVANYMPKIWSRVMFYWDSLFKCLDTVLWSLLYKQARTHIWNDMYSIRKCEFTSSKCEALCGINILNSLRLSLLLLVFSRKKFEDV